MVKRRDFLRQMSALSAAPFFIRGLEAAQDEEKKSLPISEEELLKKVPQPILPSRPDLVDMYNACWRIGLHNTKFGNEANGFVDWYIDAAFDSRIFQWDTCFALAWAKYSQGGMPNIQSLDNFYRKQHPDGAIDGVISGKDGSDTHARDAVNFTRNNLFSWSEWEYYQVTGDDSRIERVLPILRDYDRWVRKYRRHKNGHFYWSGLSSGMDNSPRSKARAFYPPYAWVDYDGNEALNAYYMYKLAEVVGNDAIAEEFRELHQDLTELINSEMWSEEDSIYWDLDKDGSFWKVKTVASFWPMWGRVTEDKHVDGLAMHLNDAKSFNRPHRVPTTAADEEKYHPEGYYWRGSVWAPTNHMITKGLEANGRHKLARDIVINHLNNQSTIFRATDTVWENYAPEYTLPGKPWSKPDFVGWSADGPIAQLIENYIGLKVDVPQNTIHWDLLTIEEVGLESLQFGDANVMLKANQRKAPTEPVEIEVNSTGKFTLEIQTESELYTVNITEGKQTLTFPENTGEEE